MDRKVLIFDGLSRRCAPECSTAPDAGGVGSPPGIERLPVRYGSRTVRQRMTTRVLAILRESSSYTWLHDRARPTGSLEEGNRGMVPGLSVLLHLHRPDLHRLLDDIP